VKANDAILHGQKYPYDRDRPNEDFAHVAARGIFADLTDRRGIKIELNRCDDDVRMEIVDAVAEIIRLAHERW